MAVTMVNFHKIIKIYDSVIRIECIGFNKDVSCFNQIDSLLPLATALNQKQSRRYKTRLLINF